MIQVTCEQCGATYQRISATKYGLREMCQGCRAEAGKAAPRPKTRRVYYSKSEIAGRFWAHVNKDGPVPSHLPHLGKCWVRERCRTSRYELFSYYGKKTPAHRVSWMLSVGDIPDGHFVLHKCDTPHCVRPDHLFLGTHLDNMRDASNKGRAGRKLVNDGPLPFSSDPANVAAILAAKRDGKSESQIAAMFGRSRALIHYAIARGEKRLAPRLPLLPAPREAQ